MAEESPGPIWGCWNRLFGFPVPTLTGRIHAPGALTKSTLLSAQLALYPEAARYMEHWPHLSGQPGTEYTYLHAAECRYGEPVISLAFVWISITFSSRSASDILIRSDWIFSTIHLSGRHNSPCLPNQSPQSLHHRKPPGGADRRFWRRGAPRCEPCSQGKGSRSVAASENGLQNAEILVRFRWGRRTHGLEQGQRRGPVPGRSRGTMGGSSSWTRSAPNPLSGQHAC